MNTTHPVKVKIPGLTIRIPSRMIRAYTDVTTRTSWAQLEDETSTSGTTDIPLSAIVLPA